MEQNALLVALGNIREDIGALRADGRHRDRRLDEIKSLLAARAGEHEEVSKRVSSLETSRTRLQAMIAAVTAASTLLTAGVAYSLQYLPTLLSR